MRSSTSSPGATCHVALDAAHVLVDGDDDRTLDTIRDTLADLGLPLRSLQPRRRSLEDVFLGRGEEHDVEVGVA